MTETACGGMLMWMGGILVGVGCSGTEVVPIMIVSGGLLSLLGMIYIKRAERDPIQ